MKNRNGIKNYARAPIDIVMNNEKTGEIIPIELKYKTKKAEIKTKEEIFNLTNQGATDIGRYNFRKDIYRIEQFVHNSKRAKKGYVLIITNDAGYFKDISQKDTLNSNFSFHEGGNINKVDESWNYKNIDPERYRFIKNENKWKYKNKNDYHWSCKGELFYQLDLIKTYSILWKEYSIINKQVFKYCLIEI